MYKKSLLLVLLLFVVLLSVSACDATLTRGSGAYITEAREVSNFDSIDLSGSGEVIVTQGEGESLTIETDDNVMEHVKAEVSGGTLKLGFEDGLNLVSPTRLIFTVGVNDLSSVRITGSGDVESDRIETDRLETTITGSGDVQIAELTADEVKARITGSGDIDLAGEAATQDVTISGSGKYRAGDLRSEKAEVSISGSGNATVWATETLDVSISGSGDVNYYGRPAMNTSGGGSGDVTGLGEK
jgi:hypothetical protein